MSITSIGGRIEYIGNGFVKLFPFPFPFQDNSHLVVVLKSAIGIEAPQTLGVDYSISGAINPAGGTVAFFTAPISGIRVCIYRRTTPTQSVNYISQDNFPAETHEAAIDRLTLLVQDISRRIDRSVRVPETNSDSQTPEIALANRLNRLVGFGPSGNLDLSVKLDEVRTLVLANPVAALSNVTDYGDLSDPITEVADYGTIA